MRATASSGVWHSIVAACVANVPHERPYPGTPSWRPAAVSPRSCAANELGWSYASRLRRIASASAHATPGTTMQTASNGRDCCVETAAAAKCSTIRRSVNNSSTCSA